MEQMTSRLLNSYQAPYGIPYYWRNEVSGELPTAVMTYVRYAADKSCPAPTDEQISLLRDYFEYYINAPCWTPEGQGWAEIKESVSQLRSPADISRWINKCLHLGLDPL